MFGQKLYYTISQKDTQPDQFEWYCDHSWEVNTHVLAPRGIVDQVSLLLDIVNPIEEVDFNIRIDDDTLSIYLNGESEVKVVYHRASAELTVNEEYADRKAHIESLARQAYLSFDRLQWHTGVTSFSYTRKGNQFDVNVCKEERVTLSLRTQWRYHRYLKWLAKNPNEG